MLGRVERLRERVEKDAAAAGIVVPLGALLGIDTDCHVGHFLFDFISESITLCIGLVPEVAETTLDAKLLTKWHAG